MSRSLYIKESIKENIHSQTAVVGLIKNDFYFNSLKQNLSEVGIEIIQPERFNLNTIILAIFLPEMDYSNIEIQDYYNQLIEESIKEYKKDMSRNVDEIALEIFFKLKRELRKHEFKKLFNE
ncbi:MAG: hypothetical protein RLZZ546_160 [Bacteroidota bacterium]